MEIHTIKTAGDTNVVSYCARPETQEGTGTTSTGKRGSGLACGVVAAEHFFFNTRVPRVWETCGHRTDVLQVTG